MTDSSARPQKGLQPPPVFQTAISQSRVKTTELLQIDAVGLLCPLPILRFKKRTQDLPGGTRVEFLADDPSGRRDLQALCEVTGHRIEWIREEEAGVLRYRICLASRKTP